jgi:nucleoside-specific outer membrane channel protein Tsx
MQRTIHRLLTAGLLLWAAGSAPAAAQAFHQSSAQVLAGRGFHDASVGNDPRDGRMTTLTLEHVSTWAYGDSFLFFDLTQGDFGDGPAGEHRIYAEWAPRLSLSRASGRRIGGGIVSDVLLAAQVNRGAGFNALLVGAGVDLAVPGARVLQVNAYWRDDNFNKPTFQVTPVWLVPVQTGPLSWVLAGFVDVAGRDAGGLDVLSQPQLLLDLGRLGGLPAGRLQAGVEWYLHDVDGTTTSVPQLAARIAW